MGFAVLSAASSFTRKSYRAAFHAAKQINGVRPDSDGDTRLIACARPLASPALTSVSVRALPKSRACDVSRLLYSESNPEPDGLKVQVADVDERSGGAGRCDHNRNMPAAASSLAGMVSRMICVCGGVPAHFGMQASMTLTGAPGCSGRKVDRASDS